MDKSVAEQISGWSDLVSMVLLGLALTVGDLTPRRPVWGWSLGHAAAIIAAMLALVIWTGFRFVYEGITTTAPREFLAGSVVYLARWLYLMLRMSHPAFKEARMFRVARALREVRNLRMGRSTDGPSFSDHEEDQNERPLNYGHDAITKERRSRNRGDWDVVMRKGVHKASDRSRSYWRGFIDPEPVWYPDVEAWDVNLLEEGMHGNKLDMFGTTELLGRDDITEKAYSQFYKVVLTAVRAPQPSPFGFVSGSQGISAMASQDVATSALQGGSTATIVQPTLSGQLVAQQLSQQQPPPMQLSSQAGRERLPAQVNFEKFTSRWSGLKPEFIANRASATDGRPIGFVARRVAADALAYVESFKMKFRTPLQVACINECLEDTRRAQFGFLDTEGPSVVNNNV